MAGALEMALAFAQMRGSKPFPLSTARICWHDLRTTAVDAKRPRTRHRRVGVGARRAGRSPRARGYQFTCITPPRTRSSTRARETSALASHGRGSSGSRSSVRPGAPSPRSRAAPFSSVASALVSRARVDERVRGGCDARELVAACREENAQLDERDADSAVTLLGRFASTAVVRRSCPADPGGGEREWLRSPAFVRTPVPSRGPRPFARPLR